MNPYWPYSDSSKTVNLVDPKALASKMLKSMSHGRALQVAQNIVDNHTVNQADKDNWTAIIKAIKSDLESVVVNKHIKNPKLKADKAGYVPVDNPVIGKSYHVRWAHKGCVWKLVEVKGDSCRLVTRKTRKEITVKISDLLNIRNH